MNSLFVETKGNDSYVSWWPSAKVWADSPYNVGYWSADCESWYQQRLNEISHGTAIPLSGTIWRSHLKSKGSPGPIKRFAINMESLCNAFLRSGVSLVDEDSVL